MRIKPVYIGFLAISHFLIGNALMGQISSSDGLVMDVNKSASEFYQEALGHEEQGTYLEAIKSYSYCLLAIQEDEIYIKGDTYKNLSDLYWRNGNNPKALETGVKALRIFEELDEEDLIIDASNRLMQIYISEGDFDRAGSMQEKILSQSSQIEEVAVMAETKRLQGVLHFFESNYTEAIALYHKSLVLHKKLNDSIEASIDMGNIAECYEKKNRIDSALYYFHLAEEIQSERNFYSGLIFIHYGKGRTFVKNKELRKGIVSYEQSVALMNKTGEKRELPFVYGLMAEVYAKLGKFDKAYFYQKRQSTSRDSIQHHEKRKRFDELKAEYQVEKAWKENEFLRKENSSKTEELEANHRIIRLQKVVLAFIILGLVLSVFYTVVFFNNQRRLKVANGTRDKLFSIIAHDLRGPIGSAKGVADLISDYDPVNEREKVNKYLKLMRESLNSTYNLLEELLTWAKTQTHSLTFKPVNLELTTLIDVTINHLEHASSQKQIQIINRMDGEQHVFADKTMITTVIRNLLSNAIKFSFENGIIELNARTKGLFLEVSIKDYGVGIDAQHIEEIFNPNSFYTTYGTKNEKGTGLGLMLCQEFIKYHKCELSVESEVGKGSSFIFTLPLASV